MASLEKQIRKILAEELQSGAASTTTVAATNGDHGVFKTVDEAVAAAKAAQEKFVDCSIDTREKVIDAIKEGFRPHIQKLLKIF
jgi:propionaldehyde dehydrogenase